MKTSLKPHGTTVRRHLLLNCDWLGLSVRFPANIEDFAQIEGHTWLDQDGTNVWKNRRILVNDHGDKVATILYNPKSSIIDSRAGLVEIANEWLYHGITPKRILDLLSDSRPFEITGINRLDLAVDFNPTQQQREIIFGLAENKYYVGGKRSGSGFWSTITTPKLSPDYKGKTVPHCQSWGHKTSNVKWKLYYKSKELLDDMGGVTFAKPYILDCWRDADLQHDDVWRLEVSIHNCNQFIYDNEYLTWHTYYNCNPIDLYRGLYTQRFQIRANEGHKDKTNDRIATFLPIGKGGEFRCRRPANSNSRNGRTTLLRHLIQSLDDPAVLLNEGTRERVLWMVEEQVKAEGLDRYFSTMVGTSLYDWIESKRVEAYDLIDAGQTDEVRRHTYTDGITPRGNADD